MAEDIPLNSEASESPFKMYTKEITFNSSSNVDASALSDNEKKLLLQSLGKDVVSMADDAIDKFLGKYHDESRLKDVSVEEMRHIIPKLFMYCDNHDTSCRKVKGLWDKRPVSWPPDVPFVDPNNRKRSKVKAGTPAKKPSKDELLSMLTYLVTQCKVKRSQSAVMSTSSSTDVSQLPTLMSPMSCHSVLSFDSCSTVWSPRSVQMYDDAMETDANCGPSSAFGSRHSLLDDGHTSSNAAINLHNARLQIDALPQSDYKQLMLEVHDILNKRNQMELTAEELTELKQHVLFLNDATSMHKSHRNTLIDIKAKYGPQSSSSCYVGEMHRSDIVENETSSECHHYVSNSEQHASASGSIDDVIDGNAALWSLSLAPDLTLTDVLEVLSCETAGSYDVSTSSAVSLPSFELQPTIANSQMPAQLVLSELEVNHSGTSNSISTPDCFVAYRGNSESTVES